MTLLASITANILLFTTLIICLNNFITGKTSIWSIGHIAFFGIGAIASGTLMIDYGLNGWLALLISVLLGSLVSLFVGLTTLRLKGDYFIILSIAVCEIVRGISIQLKGPDGITGIQRPSLFGLPLEDDWLFICIILFPFFAGIIWLAVRFYTSPMERICTLVRQNENLASLLGISSLYYKLSCFCLGSSLATATGSLYTLFTRSTDPGMITIYQSVLLFAMVLFGGVNTIRGSIVGGLMIIAVPRILEYFINIPMSSFYSAQLIQLLYGMLLIFIIRFMPQGIMGEAKNWFYGLEGE